MKLQLARVTFLLLLVAAPVVAADPGLPDGKGKDVVENTCGDCHTLERVTAQHLNEEGWIAIIREMIENGAPVNPNDMKVIVDYLVKNFGPNKKVNINQAVASEIVGALKLTSAEVDAIVAYRTRHGKFKDLSELEKVSGLADKIEAKKALIEF